MTIRVGVGRESLDGGCGRRMKSGPMRSRLRRPRQARRLPEGLWRLSGPQALGKPMFSYPVLPVMYASVNSCLGRVKISFVGENSTNSPSQNKPVRSETRAAWSMLCVTMTIV